MLIISTSKFRFFKFFITITKIIKFALKQLILNIERIFNSKRFFFKKFRKISIFFIIQSSSINRQKQKKKRIFLLFKILAKKFDTINFENKKKRFEFY